jgi:hypothetical protein
MDCMTPRRKPLWPGIPRSQPHIEYLEQWMIDRGFATGHGDNFINLLEQLSTQIYQLRATLSSVVLNLGGGENDDPVDLAKARMQEIAVYERETERQLADGIDKLTMPREGPTPEAFHSYTEQLAEMPLVKHLKKT